MKERPILFSAPMVRAILDGRKTQTRRIVNLDGRTIDSRSDGSIYVARTPRPRGVTSFEVPCPYGATGDRLWVRETHAQFVVGEGLDRSVPQCVAYRATCDEDGGFDYVNSRGEVVHLNVTKWTPAIHMPRWASRLELDVTSVRIERLQAITEDDAIAEGVKPFFEVYDRIGRDQRICSGELARDAEHRASFACLWDEINGDRVLWNQNPWVWVVEFKRAEAQERAA